jgi:tRNA(fMet)-specific endonuclease VapC
VKYLLDTNICVFIRKKSQQALQRLRQHPAGDVGISTITLAELRFGADKSQDPPKNHAAMDAFLAPLEIVEFDALAAEQYGGIRAAHAQSLGLILVTNNIGEFGRVSGLVVEDWTVP